MFIKPALLHLLCIACLFTALLTLHISPKQPPTSDTTYKIFRGAKYTTFHLQKIEKNESKGIQIRGTTDLPDGAIVVYNAWSKHHKLVEFHGMAVVKSKHFESTAWPNGDATSLRTTQEVWRIEIVFPSGHSEPDLEQPEYVSYLVGPNGENIEGPNALCFCDDKIVNCHSSNIDLKWMFIATDFRL